MSDPTLTNIQILRSPVPNKRPDPSLMLDGQLAVNYKAHDPGLFTKTVEGTLVKFGPVSITVDGLYPNHPTVVPPDGEPGNSNGEEWLDSRPAFHSPILKVWDADKDEWVTASGFTVDDATGNLTMMRWLTIDRLYANYVSIDGPLDVNGDFLPSGTNCVHNLGSASNRWKALYSCLINTTGNLTVGGDSDLTGFLQVGEYLSVDGAADILGTVTIGTDPTSGNVLKVNSPSYFESTVDIVSDVVANSNLELAGNLVGKGNVTLGDGCGVTTLDVYSDTTFHCQVNFETNPVIFDDIFVNNSLTVNGNTILGDNCAEDTLTVNSVSTFNCTTEHEGILRVGRVSGAEFYAFNAATVGGLLTVQDNVVTTGQLTIGQKATSQQTQNSDPDNTLTTKKWVLEQSQFWSEAGTTIHTTNPNRHVVPNSGTGTIGIDVDRWKAVYAEDIYTGDLHLKNERGDWTLIEEEDCLTMRNNKTGKRYAISMTPYEG